MKKKIWLDTSIISQNGTTGIGSFVYTVQNALKINNFEYSIFNWKYPKILFKYKYILYIIWLNSVFYIKSLFMKPTIFIYPGFIMPYFIHEKHKYYPVLHDLAFTREAELSLHGRLVQNFAVYTSIKKATKIITVSDTIKADIINRYKEKTPKIHVVYNSLNIVKNSNNDDILKNFNLNSKEYIICVSSADKRKNIETLIKSFYLLQRKNNNIKLVLVGKALQKYKTTYNHPNIIFTGFVDDEDLPALYKNALFYMYPSLYEGFGIPLIEAQYCGCPVLCSDIPVFREIGAESVEYCEPTAEGIAKGLESLISNTERLKELSRLGKENVKRFSIEKIAEQLNEVLNG